MKKCDFNKAGANAGRDFRPGRGPRLAALDAILRDAYRRHARGRVALAAVTACLGA